VRGSQPIVWCLLGRKAGDNNQVLALAEELGYEHEEKNIMAQPWELLTNLKLQVTLAGIDRANSSPLQAPWPDLIITAGRRNEPVARWIKHQSGGSTRLVHIGRPWAPLDTYDLIVTTPQYFLPRRNNILHNRLPLHRLLPYELESAAESLSPALQDLPQPWIAVLVGGNSGKFVFTVEKGKRLGQLASRLAGENGGSLLVADSPRTPKSTADALESSLQVPHYSYRWGRGAENPYRGMLALADAFVVTGESMSMLSEARAMGKPLYIFDMGDGDKPWWKLPHNYRYKPLSHRLGMGLGPGRMRRDVGKIQQALIDVGGAVWLDESSVEAELMSVCNQSGGDLNEELKAATEAVRRLLLPR
jgi:mitochondrial fission protein ELM1